MKKNARREGSTPKYSLMDGAPHAPLRVTKKKFERKFPHLNSLDYLRQPGTLSDTNEDENGENHDPNVGLTVFDQKELVKVKVVDTLAGCLASDMHYLIATFLGPQELLLKVQSLSSRWRRFVLEPKLWKYCRLT